MTEVGVHEAKTRLSELLRAVEQGEEVVVTRSGKAVARLVAVEPEVRRRPLLFGALADEFGDTGDWDDEEYDKEIADLFGMPPADSK